MHDHTVRAERLYRLEFENKPQVIEIIEGDHEKIGGALLRILEGDVDLILMELELEELKALIDMLAEAYVSQGGAQ